MRRGLAVVTTVLLVLATSFVASVNIWGSWWRFPNMPTAEEWQALFGASALVALGFAWYQIRQVDQSNKSLIASNELARRVNIEAVRPRLQVTLQMHRVVWKKRGGRAEGSAFIAVQNIGASPAHEVRLRVTPPFISFEKFFKPGMMESHFADVNAVFNGEVHFETLNPGNTYTWFLGHLPELFEEENGGVPRRWDVSAEYTGTMSPSPFKDSFVLDLDVEKRIEIPVDPLIRIGKDIEVVGDKLERIGKAVPSQISLDERSIAALASSRPRYVSGSGKMERLLARRRRH